ncbi:MAG: polyprenyl synthetase family protein, partial [Christiangramia sp.]|nr:polyprenyl synthetase family protein [Christiangramia sp.]
MLAISQYREAVTNYLHEKIQVKEPVNLYEPMVYILEQGGKRLRPVLVLMATDLFDCDYKKA